VHIYVVLVTSNCSHRTAVKLRYLNSNSSYSTISITELAAREISDIIINAMGAFIRYFEAFRCADGGLTRLMLVIMWLYKCPLVLRSHLPWITTDSVRYILTDMLSKHIFSHCYKLLKGDFHITPLSILHDAVQTHNASTRLYRHYEHR